MHSIPLLEIAIQSSTFFTLHLDHLDKINVAKGVRQGGTMSSKLFTKYLENSLVKVIWNEMTAESFRKWVSKRIKGM